jgi:hypothetical protein
MSRVDEIEDVLRQAAPLCLDVSRQAQNASAALRDTEWARVNLARTASANQVAGTARRRIACDQLVVRSGDFNGALEFTTSDSQHNQGQYYLRSQKVAIILTVRRKPHEEDEQPVSLQLQLADMRHLVAFEREVVVYLEIPPLGKEPRFEIATRGQELISHRLIDLIDDNGPDAMPTTIPTIGPRLTPPSPVVKPAAMPDEHESAEGGEGNHG